MDFSNKIVLINGISCDIGQKLAKTFLDMNAIVIGTYYKNKIDINNIDLIKCDNSNEKDINKLFKYIKNKYNHLDILINLSALCLDNDIYNKSKKEFMHILDVNLVGPFLFMKNASLLMNKGVIINMCSLDGIDTYQTISMDYASSKAGLINLTKNMANRFNNLKICGIAPNWINTSSIRNMDQNYLNSELKRVNQKELIDIDKVVLKILEIIVNDDIVSGEIIVMRDNYAE